MPRPLRLIVPGAPHHVVQHSTGDLKLFTNSSDYRRYLELLESKCVRYGVCIAGFALIPNHVHHVAIPESSTSLSYAIRDAHGEFARQMNGRRRRRGVLFQPRFWASPMDDAYALAALRYIELNPTHANLATAPAEWPWSSAAFHLGAASRPSIIRADIRPPNATRIDAWRAFLDAGIKPDWVRDLTRRLRLGLPCGAPSFVAATLAKHAPWRRVPASRLDDARSITPRGPRVRTIRPAAPAWSIA